MTIDPTNPTTWRVLLVDDEPDSIVTVKMVLEANGASVSEAQNGFEGFKAFERTSPDLIITDISMPEVDGYEMLKRIRAVKNGMDTLVVALTAHAMADDKVRILQAGFDGYLTHPVSLFSLMDNLRTIIKNKH